MGIFHDAVGGASTTTGTGAMTITANRPGFREVSQLPDTTIICGAFRTATNIEVGLYTKSGGASPILARTQIVNNVGGTGTAVNWGAGEKEFAGVVSAAFLPALISQNVWLADQLFRGVQLRLDYDDDSFLLSDADDQVALFLLASEFVRWIGSGSTPEMRLRQNDAGATAGPNLRLDRQSVSPAIGDRGGNVIFSGRNNAAAVTDYARIVPALSGVTAGAEAAHMQLRVLVAGSEIEALRVGGSNVAVYPDNPGSARTLLVGKASPDLAVAGFEVRADGQVNITSDGAISPAPISINLLNTDGRLLDFRRDGALVSQIKRTAGVVTYGSFLGHHPTFLALPAATSNVPPIGSVLCTVDDFFEPLPHLPKVRMSVEPADRRVYGVWLGADPETGYGMVAAVGAWKVRVIGPVQGGDLLQSSSVPGLAERQPDDVVRSSTIGKVQIGDDQTGERLVPAVLYCG